MEVHIRLDAESNGHDEVFKNYSSQSNYIKDAFGIMSNIDVLLKNQLHISQDKIMLIIIYCFMIIFVI